MDNLCHTLVGAALGEAGLKRRTRWGSATLMIASNLPDVDVLSLATGARSIAFRRGWTHGILAQAVLPVLLAIVVVWLARRRPSRPGDLPLRGGQLLLLSYIGVIGHVLMDLLNTYGVRLLMPFSGRWFYGDTLFIVDPWLWLVLASGVWIARRYRSPRVAVTAALVACAYIVSMWFAARTARAEIVDRWQQVEGRPPAAVMIGPVFATPLRRDVIIDAGTHYERGVFTWRPRGVRFDEVVVSKNDADPRVSMAREATNVRAFLVWSRFPFWTLEPATGGTRVTVGDMRFPNGRAIGGRPFSQSVVVPDSKQAAAVRGQ